jgi:hypothetical protein
MNARNLAAQLEDLSKKILANAEQIGGDELDRRAAALTRALANFGETLDASVSGKSTALVELTDLLSSPEARRLLDLASYRKIARDVAGWRITSQSVALARKELLGHAPDGSTARSLVRAIRGHIAASAPGPATSDIRKLRAEFYRIGGLAAEDAEALSHTHYRTVSNVRALAKANAIRGADHASRDVLWKEILTQSRRLRSNLRQIPEKK